MRIIKGIKVGGLQQKIFTLVLVFIFALVAAYAAVTVWHQRSLSGIVEESSAKQQDAIANASEQTMEAVIYNTMSRSTALQAYIADDLFDDIRSDVMMLQAFATELYAHAEQFGPHPIEPPRAENEGETAVMLIHAKAADPENSEALGLVANMSEIMAAMFDANERLSSVFVGTADGNMVLVNRHSATYVAEDGTPLTLEITQRPWYAQAAAAGKLIFTGVELDAYTENPMIECAAPVYCDGELVAVVAADIYLNAISDYVERSNSDGGFLCVIDSGGRVLFSSKKEGSFRVAVGADAQDLRESENEALAAFVTRALVETTGLELFEVDGKPVYMTAAPMPSVGWTVLSGVDQELTNQPTRQMLARYDEINADASASYTKGAERSVQTLIVLTVLIIALAITAALVFAGRIVKPLEAMTKRINALRNGDVAFEMEPAYRTGDEIEVLAEAFATLSKRTRDYIRQITHITAEKERIGTELALATRIQADMLPNVFPAFPDRREFDIYATMNPAKEVGGDFYDFFLIDETHLGIVIADVSGKGVPAALFMMIAKLLVQNYAMAGRSPAAVLEAVNRQICANNREEMFVTVWLGVLDIKTGEIVAANAGHEFPAVQQAGENFALIKQRHGFVIGGLEGVKYREYSLTLKPGSRLFVYTDGVPEATNANNELFGTQRMLDALNTDPSASPVEILGNVQQAVDDFVLDAEQFDDLTMLCLEYRGEQKDDKEESK